MHVIAILFTYSTEAPLLPMAVRRTEEALKDYARRNPSVTFEVVLCDDTHAPLPHKVKRDLKRRVVTSTENRRGNLRGYAWVKEQISIMSGLECDVVMKVDADAFLHKADPFLDPFLKERFEGFNGYSGSVKNHCLGACYAVSNKGLSILKTDIETMWNTVWMDEVCRYLLTFFPFMSHTLPVAEDVVISLWFHARSALKIMDFNMVASEYNWTKPKVDKPLMLLGNPGPPVADKKEQLLVVARELQHPRFDKRG